MPLVHVPCFGYRRHHCEPEHNGVQQGVGGTRVIRPVASNHHVERARQTGHERERFTGRPRAARRCSTIDLLVVD